MPTTADAYRHLADAPALLKTFRYRPRPAYRAFWNWDEIACEMFDQILASGGVFHFWGHSWQVDASSGWSRLERVFRHISHRPGVSYVNNGDLPNITYGTRGPSS